MQVVEITGEPCVGKSTILNALQKKHHFTIFNQKWLLSSLGIYTKNKILNNILFEFYMFCSGQIGAKPRLSFKFFREVMKLEEPLFRRINIYRNIIHKYAIHRRVLKVNLQQCLLVDEGISHIPYLFTGGLNSNNKLLFFKFPTDVQPWIIKLSIDLDTIVKRLGHRGHNRINVESDDIRSFAYKNKECSKVQNVLLNSYSKSVVIDLSIEGELEKIEKILSMNIAECFSEE